MDQQKNKVVIVTGSNQGLGYALVEQLVQTHPTYKVILTSRKLEAGEEARRKIVEKHPSAKNNIFVHRLDLNDSKSQTQFIDEIKKTYHHVDVLVNNAAVSQPDNFDHIFGTNYFETINFTEKIRSLLTDDAKIVMVSSGLGWLKLQAPAFAKALAEPLTLEQLNAKAKEVEKLFLAGKVDEIASMYPLYTSSKAFLNAYSRYVLLPTLKPEQSLYVINPGYCATNLNGYAGTNTIEHGAAPSLYVIGLDKQKSKELNGKFITDDMTVVDYEGPAEIKF